MATRTLNGLMPDPFACFFQLKTFLTDDVGWEVLNSRADASNYGPGDYWTSKAAMAKTQAWVHIRAPSGTQEIVIESTSSSLWELWDFSYSPTGFTYGGATPPTAADVVKISNGASKICSGNQWNGSTPVPRICFAATDEEPYGVWVFGWFEIANTPFILFGLDTVQLYDPADVDPTVYFCANSSILDNTTYRSSFIASFGKDQIRCRTSMFRGTSLESVENVLTLAPLLGSSQYNMLPTPVSPARQESLALPVNYCSLSKGIKGRSIHLKQTFRTLTNGEVFKIGSEDFIYCGNILFPWDGTIVIP